MIANRDVFVPQLFGGSSHLLDRTLAVAGRRVHVQVAADVAELHQPLCRRPFVQFATILTQLRRDVGLAELFVDAFLVAPGDGFLAVVQAVLVEPPFPLDGHLAQANVVLLRAGEVLKGGPE